MDLTYTSPIRYDFIPTPRSTIIFEFKLKGPKNGIKVNIDTNIYYKDPFTIGRVFLINSGLQSVYSSTEIKTHNIEFKIPEFQNRTQSYIYISMEPSGNFYDKVIIEDMKIVVQAIDMSPNMTIVAPSSEQKSQQDIKDLKDVVTKGYRDILRRDPDPGGLANYIQEIKNGLSVESFYDRLRTSNEYKQNEKNQKIAITSIVRNEESNGNLGRFLDCCQDLERYHNNIIYIFIEGDSSDNTYNILKNWVVQRKGSILEKIDRGYSPFPKNRDSVRTIYFADLRNKLIGLVLSRPEITEILMIDASYGWKGDLIGSLREIGADIAAPLVVMHKDENGKYLFYDVWGFRKNGREFSWFYPYTDDMVFDRPLEIDSAGGGYLIKRRVLDAGARYNGGDCEHVLFCRNAKNLGFSIKINPKIYIRKGGYKE